MKSKKSRRGGVSSKKRSARKSRSKSQSKSRSWGVRQMSDRPKRSKASDGMSMTELQFMAKSIGVPFGGLNKKELVAKINRYAHDL